MEHAFPAFPFFLNSICLKAINIPGPESAAGTLNRFRFAEQSDSELQRGEANADRWLRIGVQFISAERLYGSVMLSA